MKWPEDFQPKAFRGPTLRPWALNRQGPSLSIQPPNLHLDDCRFGPRCIVCNYLELRDGKYWCKKYDLNVRHNDLCDDYEWDGKIRVA